MSSPTQRPFRRVSGPVQLAAAWLVMIAAGTVMLRLPASARLSPLSWLDALFTATSGVCVTGLTTITVVDRLSSFGQGVLLVLIQIGGLGISTASTFLLLAVGRATIAQQLSAKDSLAAVRVKPLRLLWWVACATIIAEGIGTVLLANRIGGPDAWGFGLFHSISAFCNAGFSLYSDSLVGYRSDVVVNATIMTLIAVGGIGFIALRQLFLWLVGIVRRRRAPLFLHTRAVLWGSAVLWIGGALMFAVFEWSAGMSALASPTKFMAAGFQSVTARTAGFNTLDVSTMREATLFLTMFLMFIGGAPGSCAGGVKITTCIVVLATVRAHCRGVERVTLLKRMIPSAIVQRAFQLVTLAVLFVALVIVGLLITEEYLPAPGPRVDHFTSLAFEAVSAFGTVGLSTGITPSLSPAGKLLIILTMYVGRLGPLMVALALFRPSGGVSFEYPEEELAIG